MGAVMGAVLAACWWTAHQVLPAQPAAGAALALALFAITFGLQLGLGHRVFERGRDDASADTVNHDPNPCTIMKVVGRTLMSMPVAMTPLRHVPGMGRFARYADHIFNPTRARITLDGMILPGEDYTGIHVASMSINLGNVLKFFGKADQAGLLNAIVGTPSPLAVARNLPRMARGDEMIGRAVLDRPCRAMVLEATTDELLEPVIDGEFYKNVKRLSVHVGPRVRIPKVVGKRAVA